jgi:hypothetical protein
MHIQLCIQKVDQYQDCQQIQLNKLNNIQAASCSLIHIGNCLDFVPNRELVFVEICKKLKYGGRIIVEGTDLTETMFAYHTGVLLDKDLIPILFAGRYSCTTLNHIYTICKDVGLTIIQSRLDKYTYSIIGERPNV